MNYYNLKTILSKDCDYNIIIGERSNGKTYAALYYALKQYVKNKAQFAYIRRWQEDIIGRRASAIFAALNKDDVVTKLTNGEYDSVYYYNGAFYLAKKNEKTGKPVPDVTPCGYTFALSDNEHNKSVSYPNVRTVVFDEFLTRRTYLIDEFMLFMNVLSTIIRQRDNVKIFMLGNTVNKYSPYFSEMGLAHVKQQKQGTIDIYKYGDSGLTVAVEYCASLESKKKSNKYFAFDNENLQMITGGAWELSLYPHLPVKYDYSEILFIYYIVFDDETLQCEIINHDNMLFTYVHRKTTPIKKNSIVYSNIPNASPYYYKRLLKPIDKISQKIGMFYATEKIYFQDNSIGEIVRNYIQATERSQFSH